MNEYIKIILTTSIPLVISFITNFIMTYFKNRNIPNRNEIQKDRLNLIYQPLYSKIHNNPKIYEDKNETLKFIQEVNCLIQKYPLYVDESTCNIIRRLFIYDEIKHNSYILNHYKRNLANKLIVNIREEYSYLKDSLGYPSNYLAIKTTKMIYFFFAIFGFYYLIFTEDILSTLKIVSLTAIATFFIIALMIKLNLIKRY